MEQTNREQTNREQGVPVVFLDRDGTLNEEVHYLHRTGDLKLLPGAAEAVARFNKAGYRVIVVTNQAGVARGYYTEEDVKRLHSYLNGELVKSGAHIDGFYYCPHHPEHGIGEYKKDCACRKPGTGMLEQAAADLPAGIDKARSVMIGDKLIDTEAGHRFGIKSILVGTGYGAEIRKSQTEAGTALAAGGCTDNSYDWYAGDLNRAADILLGNR